MLRLSAGGGFVMQISSPGGRPVVLRVHQESLLPVAGRSVPVLFELTPRLLLANLFFHFT